MLQCTFKKLDFIYFSVTKLCVVFIGKKWKEISFNFLSTFFFTFHAIKLTANDWNMDNCVSLMVKVSTLKNVNCFTIAMCIMLGRVRDVWNWHYNGNDFGCIHFSFFFFSDEQLLNSKLFVDLKYKNKFGNKVWNIFSLYFTMYNVQTA